MPAKKKHKKVVHHTSARHNHAQAEENYKLALLGAITILLVVLFAWYHSVQPSSYTSSTVPMMDKLY